MQRKPHSSCAHNSNRPGIHNWTNELSQCSLTERRETLIKFHIMLFMFHFHRKLGPIVPPVVALLFLRSREESSRKVLIIDRCPLGCGWWLLPNRIGECTRGVERPDCTFVVAVVVDADGIWKMRRSRDSTPVPTWIMLHGINVFWWEGTFTLIDNGIELATEKERVIGSFQLMADRCRWTLVQERKFIHSKFSVAIHWYVHRYFDWHAFFVTQVHL